MDEGWSLEPEGARAAPREAEEGGSRSTLGVNAVAGEIGQGRAGEAATRPAGPPRGAAASPGSGPVRGPAAAPGSGPLEAPAPAPAAARPASLPPPSGGARSLPARVPSTPPGFSPERRPVSLALGQDSADELAAGDDFAQEAPPVMELDEEAGSAGERVPSGDPTALMDLDGPDMTELVRRHTGELRRRPGIVGDLRYVLPALLRFVKIRRNLRALRSKLQVEREARERLVRVMARELASDTAVDAPALREARERMAEIQAARAAAAAEVAAAAFEIVELREDAEAEALGAAAEIARLEDALATADRDRGLLERAIVAHRKGTAGLQQSVTRLDRRIARLEDRLDAASDDDVARREAELAATRAEREAVVRAGPAMEAELQTLGPRIEALQARRAELEAALAVTHERAREREERGATRLAAARARQEQAEAAVHAADRDAREVLRALGERLCLDRPPGAASWLATLDRYDSAIAALQRQGLEQTEHLHGIDRGAMLRGAVLAVAFGMAAAALVWLVSMLG